MESAQKWFTSMCVLVLAVCLFIEKGLAVNCYMCNSHLHGDDCDNLPEERRHLYKLNCDFLEGNKTYTMCRKMFQNLQGDVRVIRQCATHGDMGCLRRTGTRNVNIIYCHCDGDLCNQGPVTIPHLTTYLTAAIATYFIPRMYHALRA